MKISFIGTGTMGSVTRGNQSLLVDDILFDVGSGTVKRMESQGIYTKNINCLVISHCHADHFFDLPNYLIGRNIRNEHTKRTLPIIGGVGIKKKAIELFQLAFGDGNKDKYKHFERDFNVKFIELKNGEKYEEAGFKITAYDLEHGDCKPITGFILEKDGKKLGYASVTILCEILQIMCKEAEIMCIDATISVPTRMHIGLEEVLWLKEQNTSTRFLAIHWSDYVLSHIMEVEFPEDGESIEV